MRDHDGGITKHNSHEMTENTKMIQTFAFLPDCHIPPPAQISKHRDHDHDN